MKYLLLMLSCCSALAQLPVIPWRVVNGDTFGPNNPAGLVYWYDAAYGVAATNGGNHTAIQGENMVYWTNKSGTTGDPVLSFSTPGTDKAVFSTNSANNSLPGLYFDGTSVYSSANTMTNYVQTNWIFIIMRCNFSAGKPTAIDLGGNNSIGLDGSAFNYSLNFYGCPGGTNFATGGNPQINTGCSYTNKWVLISLKCGGLGSKVRTNAVDAATALGINTNAFGSTILCGEASFGGAAGWYGWMAEILVYHADLSAGDVAIVENHLMGKYALPDLSGHTELEFVTGQTVGSLRADITGNVGLVARNTNDLFITQIGRWVVSGNSATHLLKAYLSGVLKGSVTIATSGAPAGAYKYGALSSTVFFPGAGLGNVVESTEANGGDQWYDSNTSTTPGDGAIFPAFNEVLNGASGHAYVPPNFKYFTP